MTRRRSPATALTRVGFLLGFLLTACGRTEAVDPSPLGTGGRGVTGGSDQSGRGTGGAGAGGRGGAGVGGNSAGAGGSLGTLPPTSIYCFPDRCQPPAQQCCLTSTATMLTGMCLDAQAACPSLYFKQCADASACNSGDICCIGLGPTRLETACSSLADCLAASGHIACTSDLYCQPVGGSCCGGPTHGGVCLGPSGACIP